MFSFPLGNIIILNINLKQPIRNQLQIKLNLYINYIFRLIRSRRKKNTYTIITIMKKYLSSQDNSVLVIENKFLKSNKRNIRQSSECNAPLGYCDVRIAEIKQVGNLRAHLSTNKHAFLHD